MAAYLAKSGNYPGLDPILRLPSGRACGYDGGWPQRTYHPLSKKSGFIIWKRPPAASGSAKTWPQGFDEDAWLRGNHSHARGPEQRPSKYVPYFGPVITGTIIPRRYCSNKPAVPQKPDETIDALRTGHIVVRTQVEDDDQESTACRALPDEGDAGDTVEVLLSEDELSDLATTGREFSMP